MLKFTEDLGPYIHFFYFTTQTKLTRRTFRTFFDRFPAHEPLPRSRSRLAIVFKPARTAVLIYLQRETGGNEWRRNKRAMSRRQRAISVTQPLIPFCRASLHTRHPIPLSAPVRLPLYACHSLPFSSDHPPSSVPLAADAAILLCLRLRRGGRPRS